MRILNREAFMQCPEGTVFFDYKPHCSGDLSIKTCGAAQLRDERGVLNDFFRLGIDPVMSIAEPGATESVGSDVRFDLLERAIAGERFDLFFDCGGRDAMYAADALFAVLDPEDVRRLIELLSEAPGVKEPG